MGSDLIVAALDTYGDVRDLHSGMPRFPLDNPDNVTGTDAYQARWEIAHALRPQPRRVFEFGGHFGFGLITLLDACPEVEWAGWTDNESAIAGSNEACAQNLAAYLDRRPTPCKLWHSTTVADAAGLRAQLVVVDGDHSYHGCLVDLALAHAMRPNTIVVDDYLNIGGVAQAVHDFAAYAGYEIGVVHAGTGLAVLT